MTLGPPTNACFREDQTRLRSWSGFDTGSVFQKTALIWLKMAVLAPTPSASFRIAIALKPGAFTIMRAANRRSWRARSTQAAPQRSRSSSRFTSFLGLRPHDAGDRLRHAPPLLL